MICYGNMIEGSDSLRRVYLNSSDFHHQSIGKQKLEKLRNNYKFELARELEEDFSETLNPKGEFEKEFFINYFVNKASSYIVDLATSDWSIDRKAILSERALTAMSYGLTSKLRKSPSSTPKSELIDLIYNMKRPILAFNSALYDMLKK